MLRADLCFTHSTLHCKHCGSARGPAKVSQFLDVAATLSQAIFICFSKLLLHENNCA